MNIINKSAKYKESANLHDCLFRNELRIWFIPIIYRYSKYTIDNTRINRNSINYTTNSNFKKLGNSSSGFDCRYLGIK